MELMDTILKGGPVALTIGAFLFGWYVLNQLDRKLIDEVERLEREIATRVESRLGKLEEKLDRLNDKISEILLRGK